MSLFHYRNILSLSHGRFFPSALGFIVHIGTVLGAAQLSFPPFFFRFD